tara:strand:- start:503 stop:1609 length:1107 start_codon:yes stop_codon:yes gene_type:complete
MIKVHLNLKKTRDNSYDILIGRNLLNIIVGDLKRKKIANRYVIITDKIVERLFGRNLLRQLKGKGIKADLISFNAGEQNKNIRTFNELIEKVHSLGLDRSSAVIALGGGVVGDIAGLVAATYMRGIKYIQVPTTLLAYVDSSIGGKVAVDLKSGKNSCGAFYQPAGVYIDISLVKNLPQKELLNGLAEVIKHAIIKDKKLFGFIEKNVKSILARDESIFMRLVKRNCEIKARIVEEDEKEKNLRKIVNYGHTIGHALETLTNYKTYKHGQAISIGMIAASRLSNRMGWLSRNELKKQIALFKKIGLPISLPKIKPERIISELRKDKKAVSGKIQLVLPEKIGKMKAVKGKYGLNIPITVIHRALKESS